MFENIRDIIKERINPLFSREIGKLSAINRKYAKPSIKITRGVSIVLFLLRLYLIFLVILLAYKFFTLIQR